ncbi:hypothetical protein HPB52_012614 [Rhipicephalus sanguineus]|uniref:exodeoxyribonuclease III n=1 Tax=Rhipicephalus sanguineus TaxID=34632 RepID=A0A9D4QEJ0_RHISA|nr:hypothetical protein HPB52_012614 [Rhipicephalus sanguineus]
MSTFKFATWNVRGFRDSYKQREILAFAQAQNIDVLFVLETNFRTPLDVARFRRDFHVDAFFSLTNARACGVGAIFISGRFRQRAHCTFGADGRMLFLDVYISGKRTRFVNIYAPVTRSNTNGFFKDLHQILLEPLPHVLLGDFNCVVDSQRDVRGPGRGRSTYYAKELLKVLKHLKLTDTWMYVHEDLFVPTRTSRTTASRIDRTYVPDFLLPSVVDCEVLTPSSSLAGKSDHSPLVTTLRGTPGPHNGNHGWRLDPSLLEDEHSVEQIRDRLRASLRDAPPMTPQVCDGVAEATWQKALERAHLASARIKHLDLTLREKALAAKTCICAFAYYASRIAVIPSRTVTQLNKLIGSLLWDDKPAPVKRHLLQLPENEGGLGLPHIMTMSKILALKTARCLHQATDFFGKGLLRYWCSTNTKFLDAERHLGPLAESPSPFYKTAANTKRMLDTEATECDVDKDPPIRIVEAITRHQLSPDEKRKTKRWRQKQVKQGHDLPKEVRDFMWKRNWEVLPTRDRLHRFGVVPSARCPNCRADESAHHAMFECLAAKPVWRLVAKDFKIRPPPSLDRNRGAFAKLVIACTLFVIWKRRCVAEGKKTPVRAAYPAVSRIRLMVWKHLSEQLEASGEEKFLRRWHTRFFFLKDGNLSMPITPY